MVDCEDAADLFPRMPDTYAKWNKLTKSEEFSNYFETYILQNFAHGCLAGVRRSAGLGENFFYTNAIESTHKKFKTYIKQDKMDNQISGMINPKSSWTEAALKYVEMIAVHHRNLERALMDQGNWICITIST